MSDAEAAARRDAAVLPDAHRLAPLAAGRDGWGHDKSVVREPENWAALALPDAGRPDPPASPAAAFPVLPPDPAAAEPPDARLVARPADGRGLLTAPREPLWPVAALEVRDESLHPDAAAAERSQAEAEPPVSPAARPLREPLGRAGAVQKESVLVSDRWLPVSSAEVSGQGEQAGLG